MRAINMIRQPLFCLRIFIVALAATVLGILFWPLELSIYAGADGSSVWYWGDDPPVSTEDANYWSYISFRPLLYLSVFIALISILLFWYESRIRVKL